MNVAFPAVLLFLLLSPGILFHYRYQPREVRAADMSPFGRTVIYVALLSIIFNSAAMAITVSWFGYEFHLGQLVRLLLDGRAANNDSGLEAVFARLDRHPIEPLAFFALANGLALGAAFLWRGAVAHLKLDHPSFRFYRSLRPEAPWHYLFSGIDVIDSTPDAIVIAALVTVKDMTLLYTGLLVDYELTDKGELDRIMLANAARRNLTEDKTESDSPMSPANADRFYPIEGDCLVLRSSEITTLNIKFLVLEELDNTEK